jgi:hypothetical protein
MCTICKTPTTDPKQRLEQIAQALKKKQITQDHADALINSALGISESKRNVKADADWERNYRKGRE